jgi:hypothetical protein
MTRLKSQYSAHVSGWRTGAALIPFGLFFTSAAAHHIGIDRPFGINNFGMFQRRKKVQKDPDVVNEPVVLGIVKEQTASDVVKEYNLRIESFIRGLPGRNSSGLRGEGDLLQRLFQWGIQSCSDNAWLEKRHANQIQEYSNENLARQKAQDEVDKISKDLGDTEIQMETLKAKIKTLTSNHEDKVRRMQQDYDELIQQHESEKHRLTAQLLVNVGKAERWPDDRIKLEFGNLKHMIENMATAKRLRLAEGQRVQFDFDSTGFLSRTGKEQVRYLIRNRIWIILYHHFFGSPFGFGVLGARMDQNPLLMTFDSWRRVVNGSNDTSEIHWCLQFTIRD